MSDSGLQVLVKPFIFLFAPLRPVLRSLYPICWNCLYWKHNFETHVISCSQHMLTQYILFWLFQADIWLFSMDQRDIVMLAKDYSEEINRETKPAIILHSILIQICHVFVLCVLSSLVFGALMVILDAMYP